MTFFEKFLKKSTKPLSPHALLDDPKRLLRKNRTKFTASRNHANVFPKNVHSSRIKHQRLQPKLKPQKNAQQNFNFRNAAKATNAR